MEQKINLAEFLEANLITFIDSNSRDAVIRSLVDTLDDEHLLQDKETFRKAIIHREQIVTTGIGMKVAIPHAKLPDYETFFIAIGILKKGVDWGSLDEAPVNLVFMVGGPDDKQTEYLQILSTLTRALKNDALRKGLTEAKTAKEVLTLFNGNAKEGA